MACWYQSNNPRECNAPFLSTLVSCDADCWDENGKETWYVGIEVVTAMVQLQLGFLCPTWEIFGWRIWEDNWAGGSSDPLGKKKIWCLVKFRVWQCDGIFKLWPIREAFIDFSRRGRQAEWWYMRGSSLGSRVGSPIYWSSDRVWIEGKRIRGGC